MIKEIQASGSLLCKYSLQSFMQHFSSLSFCLTVVFRGECRENPSFISLEAFERSHKSAKYLLEVPLFV